MTKKFCKKCGSALTKERARFCTICGATVDSAEKKDIESQETAPLLDGQTDQTVPANVAATEVLPASMAPSNFETEEMPQMRITAQAEKSATAVVSDAPVTQPQKKRGKAAQALQPSLQPSGGRRKLLLAASLGVVALVAVSIFLVISRRPPETQGANLPADKAQPATSAQPADQKSNQQLDQQSGAGANNQAQQQTSPQPDSATGAIKSPAAHQAEAASNTQRPSVAKPTAPASQENQPANGTVSAEQSLNQGMTYLNSGRYQEAIGEFERVKKLDPTNKNVYYLIGRTYQGMNQLELALEAYRQCTSGHYTSVSQSAVKKLEKEVKKLNEK